MKARAAVAVEAGHPLVIEEIDVAAPKAGEVLVQMVATGVCHTDAFTLSGMIQKAYSLVCLVTKGVGSLSKLAKG